MQTKRPVANLLLKSKEQNAVLLHRKLQREHPLDKESFLGAKALHYPVQLVSQKVFRTRPDCCQRKKEHGAG